MSFFILANLIGFLKVKNNLYLNLNEHFSTDILRYALVYSNKNLPHWKALNLFE